MRHVRLKVVILRQGYNLPPDHCLVSGRRFSYVDISNRRLWIPVGIERSLKVGWVWCHSSWDRSFSRFNVSPHVLDVLCSRSYSSTYLTVALGELVVSVLATGPKVRGFDPDRGRWIFKIRSTTSFGGEVKPSVPCRRFTTCKRSFGHE
jgi:hypothetical protein